MTRFLSVSIRILFTILYLFTLGNFGFLVYFITTGLKQQVLDTPHWIPTLLLICSLFVLTVYFIISVYSAHTKRNSIFSFPFHEAWQNIVFVGHILLCLFLIGTGLFFFLSIANEKPPQFFPFDDPKATYTVLKDNAGFYQITYDSPSDMNAHMDCSTNGGCKRVVDHHISVMIGSSPIDLKYLRNQHVQVKGNFMFSKKQCLANVCKSLPSSYLVLAIAGIRRVK